MTTRYGLIVGLLCGLGLSTAHAAEKVGEATVSKNQVTGTLGELVRSIGVGDGVSGNEVVRTGLNSATLLKFLDNSNLSIGASSTIVLDRFVYDPKGTADTVIFNLTKGSLRFVSGHSDPTKFAIKTQVATLGVRGTDFVALCDGSNRCGVVVAKGKVRVCPHPELPVDCPDAYDLDGTLNFTIVGANGKNTGAKPIPAALVAAVIRAVAAGQDGLSLAKIESGRFGNIHLDAPKPINATRG